jgi:glucose/arabinose dehydrogenase
MRAIRSSIVFAALLSLCVGHNAHAAISGTTQVASGLGLPLFATFAPGDNNHLFVLEKGGNVKVIDLNSKTVIATPFLNIPDTDPSNEGGLLGLAFHPDYANPTSQNRGKFYIYVSVDNGGLPVTAGTAATATSPFSTHIRQYMVSSNPLVANAAPTEIMSWPRPQDNHVGGWIGFSPHDGYLYINSGDGGAGNDQAAGHYEPGGNAQNISNAPNDFMGKQLRIDVNSDAFPADASRNYAIPATNPFVGVTGADEIWAYGLRNPYRGSFDRDTGNQWIADVGEGTREEIDFQSVHSTGGVNYGWRLREGKIATPTVGGTCTGCTDPVYDYTHGSGSFQGNAVIGGYVYHGPDPSLQNIYFFADEISGHVWEMNTSTFAVTNIDGLLTPNTGLITNPASFAEDSVGNLYLIAYGSGSVFKINTSQLLAGDYNANGTVDAADYILWRKTLGSTTVLAADGSHNNKVDQADYTIWQNNFGNTVHTSSPGAGSTIPELASIAYIVEFMVLLAFRWRLVARVR